ncbi:hypothetical protein V6N13_017614 [Hibiscus sabdariffa]
MLVAMQLSFASALPMVLKSAIELDLLEIMAKARPGALLSTTNPDAPVMLDRMFRCLSSYSVLTCSLRTRPNGKVERLYGLGPVCKFFTKNEYGGSVSSISLLVQDKVYMECWYNLKDAVLKGGSAFNKANGKPVFDYLGSDQRLNKIFNKGMFDLSSINMKWILERYDGFEGLKTLVDVGGGTGLCLNMIVSKYPPLKSSTSICLTSSTMLLLSPVICHSFDDESCLKIFNKCYEALPENGKVIVVENILADYPDPGLVTKFVTLSDTLMLAHNLGKERSEKEFEALAKGAGFRGFQVKCRVYSVCVMEFESLS